MAKFRGTQNLIEVGNIRFSVILFYNTV